MLLNYVDFITNLPPKVSSIVRWVLPKFAGIWQN